MYAYNARGFVEVIVLLITGLRWHLDTRDIVPDGRRYRISSTVGGSKPSI